MADYPMADVPYVRPKIVGVPYYNAEGLVGRRPYFSQPSFGRGRRPYGKGKYRKTGYYGRYNRQKVSMKRERKFRDVINVTINPVKQQGSVIGEALLTIDAGTSESQRLGRKIVLTKISLRFKVFLNPDFAYGNVVRIMIVVDKQCNGVMFTVPEVLDKGPDTEETYHSFMQLANKGRFKILMDKFIQMNYLTGVKTSGTAGTGHGVSRNFEYHKDCAIPILYDGVVGSITERCCNNIGVLIMAEREEATSPDSTCGVIMDARLRFVG